MANLAHAAVADEFGMVDNVTALPLRYSEASGYEAEWLLLFTNKGDNYRPSLFEVDEVLKNVTWLPCKRRVKQGDCL